MRLPMEAGREIIIARDKHGGKIVIHKNQGPGFDLETDGRIALSGTLAKKIAEKLLEFAQQKAERTGPWSAE